MTDYEFWIAGCQICGHPEVTHSTMSGMRKFRALFGCTPKICEYIWDYLEIALLHPPGAKPFHMLCALLFLKQYCIEELNSIITHLDPKTYRKWVWIYVELIAYHVPVIDFESRFDGAKSGATCFTSLDCTDCPIQEPSPFDSKWYSYKLRKAGLRYEIGLNIQLGDIVWTNGPFPCGDFPDLTIAREDYLEEINEGEMTVADDGYRDVNYFIHPHGFPETNLHQKQIMSRHETINERLKEFRVLSSRFRHDISLHQMCFLAIVNITQLKIHHGEPLFELTPL